jgi:hypothetical protein
MLIRFRPLFAVLWFGLALSAAAATSKVVKVLPHFLDAKGRHSLSPSLYDRDAYQAHLREKPKLRSGLRFDIEYRAVKAAQPRLRVEMRTIKEGRPQIKTLESPVKTSVYFTRWAKLGVSGEEYRQLGELNGWRVTLWDGDQLLGERRSFLWPADTQLPTPAIPPK